MIKCSLNTIINKHQEISNDKTLLLPLEVLSITKFLYLEEDLNFNYKSIKRL